MTIYSGIFNSINGDRKYNAWWFAKYFATFIGNGVFPNPSTGLQVMADERMQVKVRPGSGWVDGYFLYSDTDHVLKLDVSDGVLKRIDRIVMRLDYLTRKIDIVVKKGVLSSKPTAPTLQRDTDYVELALADVAITNGTTIITQADITDTRLNKTLCGIVHGTVNQVDTTTLFNQYQSWITQQKEAYETDLATWTKAKKLSFDEWVATQQKEFSEWLVAQDTALSEWRNGQQTDFTSWRDVQKSDFDNWFETIKGVLDGDIAATLTAKVTALETHAADKNNPHKVTKAQVGLASVLNYGVATQAEAEAGTSNAKYMTPLSTKQAITKQAATLVTTHVDDKTNPHGVTKSQVGLGNVDNVKQATKAEFDTHTKQIASADKLGHVKVGDSLEISPDGTLNVISHNYFGVRIDKTNSNPKTAVTRIGKSKGMNANDFWNVYPYNAIRAVLVKNGVVQAELNKNLSHNYVASDGDVFMEFSKFWWKFENTPTHLEVKIATAEVEGFVSPAFEGKEKIYIGRYLGYALGGKLRSIKGYEPTGDKTIGAFRAIAQANGAGYSQLPYLATLAVQVLYLVQYANLDSQTALGRGWVDSPTGYANTGGTDGEGFNYGETTGNLQMSIYGIEDFWGNKLQWLDGIVTDANSDILISNGSFNDNGSGYTKHTNTGAVKGDGGYIKDVMGGDITGFLTADKSGSSTTYYCDIVYIRPTRVAYFGGGRSYASFAGAFHLRLSDVASFSAAHIGARLYFS